MAGIHQTLREVRELYAAMTGSAERAERAARKMEDYNRQAEQMLRTSGQEIRDRAASLDRAYDRLERRVEAQASEGSKWAFLLQLLIVGFFAALLAGIARAIVDWGLETVLPWWVG